MRNQKNGRSGFSRKQKILIALLMSVTITGIFRALQLLRLLFLPNHSPSSALTCSIDLNIFYVMYVTGQSRKIAMGYYNEGKNINLIFLNKLLLYL